MVPQRLASVPAYPVAASPLSREPSRAQQWARASIPNTDSAGRAYWVAKPGESLHVDSTDAEWLWQPGIDRHAFFGWAASRGMDTNPAQPAQGVGRRKLHGGNRGVRKPGSTRQQIGLTAGETAPIPSATRRFPVAPATGLRLECVAATSTRMLVTAGKDRPELIVRCAALDSGLVRNAGLRACSASRATRRNRAAPDVGNRDHQRSGGVESRHSASGPRPVLDGDASREMARRTTLRVRADSTEEAPRRSPEWPGIAAVARGPIHHQRAGTWHELLATSARHWPMTHGRDRGAVESANSARHGGECNLPAHHHSSGAG